MVTEGTKFHEKSTLSDGDSQNIKQMCVFVMVSFNVMKHYKSGAFTYDELSGVFQGNR